MDWQDKLITLYVLVCEEYHNTLWAHVERFSNNSQPAFTDEEVLTLYLFGIVQHQRTVSAIHEYACDHLRGWFPHLTSYGGFVQRLNRLHAALPALSEAMLAACSRAGVLEEERLVDSMPIVMAQEKRSSRARVAADYADKGYCASKKMYYYGMKVHLITQRQPGHMPLPEYVGITAASTNDLSALREVAPRLQDCELFGDKIYSDRDFQERLEQNQQVRLYTPVKRRKGQEELLMTDRAFSEAVSRVRQPIESLIGWLNEKTGLEVASKVRSYEGLMVHIFGRLAAALFMLAFNL